MEYQRQSEDELYRLTRFLVLERLKIENTMKVS